MLAPTPLTIGGITVHARGRLDLLETRLVHIAGSLDPTPHGSVVAEHAAIAIAAHSASCCSTTALASPLPPWTP